MIRYEGSLFYAGAEHFNWAIISGSGFDPRPAAYYKKKYEAAVKEADKILNPEENEEITIHSASSEDIELAPQTLSGKL